MVIRGCVHPRIAINARDLLAEEAHCLGVQRCARGAEAKESVSEWALSNANDDSDAGSNAHNGSERTFADHGRNRCVLHLVAQLGSERVRDAVPDGRGGAPEQVLRAVVHQSIEMRATTRRFISAAAARRCAAKEPAPAPIGIALPPDLAERMADHVNDGLDAEEVARARAAVDADREPATPLVAEMQQIIRIRGPLSLPEFMRSALQHPIHGYYTSQHGEDGADVFGKRGDFITSPEVSQVFGELVGLWCVATWRQMGSPEGFRLVEIGPGRGTLMDDLLRAASRFDDFASALERVEMVETSPVLAAVQRETLGCAASDHDGGSGDDGGVSNRHGVATQWRHRLNDVPKCPVLLVGHELLDALPAHQFELTERGWCERMVDIAPNDDSSGLHFSLALSPTPTLAAEMLLKNFANAPPPGSASDEAQAEAAAVDKRARGLAAGDAARGAAAIGDVVEVVPAAAALVQDIALRVRESGGAALLLDYGDVTGGVPSLRGVRDHEFVDVLSMPGRSDITADVGECSFMYRYILRESCSQFDSLPLTSSQDFGAMRRAVEGLRRSGEGEGAEGEGAEGEGGAVAAFGPIEQSHFLHQMGIGARMERLVHAAFDAAEGEGEGGRAKAEAEAGELVEAYNRLAGREEGQMGKVYKVFAIASEAHGTPIAFEV